MLNAAKKIAKDLNVKGFRKLALKRTLYVVGKQCAFMNKETAFALIAGLEAAGWTIEQRATIIELAEKGLLDSVTIRP